jgi:hypothetical protein
VDAPGERDDERNVRKRLALDGGEVMHHDDADARPRVTVMR